MKIYTDKIGAIQEEKKMQTAKEHLNHFKNLTTNLLGELSQSELMKLPTRAREVIKDNLRARYQFENATEKFNLDALGLDPSSLLEYLKDNARKWSAYVFEHKDNEYNIVNPEQYLKVFTHYADTDDKKHLLKLYTDVASSFNALADAGVQPDVVGLMEAFPSVFKRARLKENDRSPFVMLDNERLAFHFQYVESQKRIPRIKSKEILKQLGVEPINVTDKQTENNGQDEKR